MPDFEAELTALALVLRAVVRSHPDREALRRELSTSLTHVQMKQLLGGAEPTPDALRKALAPFLADLDAPPLPP